MRTKTTMTSANSPVAVVFTALILAIGGLTASANAAPVAVTNPGFEYPAGPVGAGGVIDSAVDGTDPQTGWVKTGGGQIYNPGANENAPEGSNSYLILSGVDVGTAYNAGNGSILQTLDDPLKEGVYTLNVQVGENITSGSIFGTYQVQLGVIEGSAFRALAEESSLAPSGGFLLETVTFDTATLGAADLDATLGLPLAIQLVGTVEGTDNIQVLFDDVSLNFEPAPTNVDVYLKAQRFPKSMFGGGDVPMWGFASCNADFSVCAAPDAPGPRIDAFAGFDLSIHVQNTLDIPVSIAIAGQTQAGDRAPVMMEGVAPPRVRSFTREVPAATPTGPGEDTYTWADLRGGTYLYQSATHPSIQVPMGLYGPLVVSEGPGTAYGETFVTEALLLFSEIDPIQNIRVDSAASVLPDTTCVSLADYNEFPTAGYPCTVDYDPMYFLINGQPTVEFPAGDPGDVALLRFLNAGLRSHTPSLIGVDLGLVAEDGNKYPGSARKQSVALLPAGKTLDALVNLPDSHITLSLFDRMPTFSNENLPNGGAIGSVVVGDGSGVLPPPIKLAADDGPYAVLEDTPLSIDDISGVLANDSLQSPTSLTVARDPMNGTVALNLDGSFTYTPNLDYSGPDSFSYSSDGNVARVTLSVSFANDAPVANADGPYSNGVGSTITVAAPGVLGNDQDVDGDPLTAVLVDDATSGTLSLLPDGSFTFSGTGPATFTYRADDGTTTSDPVTVTVEPIEAAGIALTVVDENDVAISDYRWTVEEEAMWHPDPGATTPTTESLATNFHTSHMPIVAQGCVGTACAPGEAPTPFGAAALDSAKHYYVSVLPADAASDPGHTIGAARILPGADAVEVLTHTSPLPVAQISMFVFEDNSPTNGAVDGNETGLGGFQVTLEDAGGRYGASGGPMSQDAFGNPLTNALDCFGGSPPAAGLIVSCPDTQENRDLERVGEVLIKNLYPGKYGVVTSPPLDADGDWVQTSTIEGTKVIDAWVKAGEPAFFQEFGPAGWHVFVGFVSPTRTAAVKPAGGANTVTGNVTNMHMSRPPVQTLHSSGSYDALAHTKAWVGLNSAGGTGANYAAIQAADDGSFTISGVPDGNYQLVVWDAYLDQVIAFRNVTFPGNGDLGEVPVFQWFARSEHTVFLDDGCGGTVPEGVQDGIHQDCEGFLPEQAVNLRWRDGTVNQSAPTDTEGYVPFDETFPFFHWQVLEVDFARFKATGLTTTVDGGGAVLTTGNVLNPQVQADDATTRTETGPVLTQGFQGFLGQTSVFEWGKAPYAKGENGGISGIVYYASTRAENNPQLAVGEPWEPGVPSATVRLYREVPRSSIPVEIVNPGFEYPAGPVGSGGVIDSAVNGTDPQTGWVKSGGGQIYNPGLNENAPEGSNSYLILSGVGGGYNEGDGAVQQQLTELLQDGAYTLSVQVGENVTASSSFGSYKVQLGVMDVDTSGVETFVLLAEDSNTLAPVNQFLTSTVTYSASADDANLDLPLVIRLVGTVAGTGQVQVLFDDVRLDYATTGLALVQETQTDSWDKSLPRDCPGAAIADLDITGGQLNEDGTITNNKCYDGLRNFNQARPAVFDGGYAFMDIDPGKYIVEVVPPAGYTLVKEEDNNVGFGDTYNVAPISPVWPGAILPDGALIEDVLFADAGLAQPPCVGELRVVPDFLALFPGETVEAPYAGVSRPLCDRKEVILSDQGQAAADFFLFAGAPIAGHFVGMILDDTAQEFNADSPQFGEKWAPPYVPVSILDFAGNEISRVYSDQWGRMNGLVPSTFTANMPSPSGYAPAMLMTCMNDPGPIPDPANPGNMIIDPNYNPAYSNFCYTFQYMPGTTTYLDTPVLPVSAFASGYNPPDCAISTDSPVIREVNGSGKGPLVAPGGTLTILSQGTTTVSNPDYTGPTGAEPKTITREYGFGTVVGEVRLNGVALDPASISWVDDTTITWAVPANFVVGEYQLSVTRGDNFNSTEHAITVTVSPDETPLRVPSADYPTIQAAVDAAGNGALILVAPGSYDENVIMWKPVRLQGTGAGSTTINAVKRPTERIAEWRTKMDCLFGIGDGCTQVVDALPTQLPGAAGFDTDEGAAVTVVAPFDSGPGTTRPANRFRGRASRIDGFSITGGDTGGGIFVNGYAHQLEIGNNHVFGNSGSFHGGIRIGRPFLELDTDGPYEFNMQVSVHNNSITQNGALDGAGGGLSIATGTDRYNVSENFVCGNFSAADGGGIGHLGLSHRGVIANNKILFNQSFDQAQTRSGGGLFIGGEVPVAGTLTKGSGRVTVDGNLIQGNQAGAGHGGGIRTQFVNGQDVLNTLNPRNGRARPGQWWNVTIVNNMIVNNVAGWSGAGISMQDTARSFVVNNTVAHNDSTSTVAATFTADPNMSLAQPAGVATELHSPVLTAAIPSQGNTDAYREFSNPLLSNNIVWQNRSSHYEVTGGAAGLVPALSEDCAGDYDDYGVLGGGFALSPANSIETTDGVDPLFADAYCNGGRDAPGPMQALPALDEGGAAWIDVRFGSLRPGGDYHIDASSPAVDAGSPTRAPIIDFDGEMRPEGDSFDIGADEVPALPTGFVTYSTGEFGDVSVGTSETLDITATVSGVAVTFSSATSLAAPYAMVTDGCSGLVVPPGGTCTFTVSFSPTSSGDSVASFDVASDIPSSPQAVDLSGTGVTLGTVAFTSAAPFSLNGETLEFGNLPNGDYESTVTLTVSGSPVLFETLNLTGSGRFSISNEDNGDTCSDVLVAAGDSCTITIFFNANGGNGGNLRNATLEVPHFGSGSPQALAITGR